LRATGAAFHFPRQTFPYPPDPIFFFNYQFRECDLRFLNGTGTHCQELRLTNCCSCFFCLLRVISFILFIFLIFSSFDEDN
jgi:hypothetical protein